MKTSTSIILVLGGVVAIGGAYYLYNKGKSKASVVYTTGQTQTTTQPKTTNEWDVLGIFAGGLSSALSKIDFSSKPAIGAGGYTQEQLDWAATGNAYNGI